MCDIIHPDPVTPRCDVTVRATRPDGSSFEFVTVCRIDTPVEIVYFKNGGILQTVIRKKLNESHQMA